MKKLILLFALILRGCVPQLAPAQNSNPQSSFSNQVLAGSPSVYVTFNNSSNYFRENTTGVNFIATGCAGTVVPAQAGFDNSSATNTAALLPYNGCIYAPNDTLGDFEWSSPFSVMIQVDLLNYARTAGTTEVLASKGDIGSGGKYWEITLTMNSQNNAQICFYNYGNGGIVTSHTSFTTYLCTQLSVTYDIPNGYNYNIIATSDGSGSPGYNASAAYGGLGLYVNGIANNSAPTTSSLYAAGSLVVVGSGGTGYPNSFPITTSTVTPNSGCHFLSFGTASSGVVTGPTQTAPGSPVNNSGCTSAYTVIASPYVVTVNTNPTSNSTFTSTGGGTGCVISGSVTTAGVVSYTQDTNCTSAPTLTIASGSLTATANPGSGATFTSSMFGASMSTSTTAPMYIGGALVSGSPKGISYANTSQAGTLIDEFAIFPYVLSQTQIQSLFYLTKFYQRVLKTVPATPLTLIFSDDGCADPDNIFALSEVIGLQKLGFIRLAGVEDVAGDGVSEALYRQMLDQAGLAHIPLSVPSSFVSLANVCTAANMNTYNSATPQSASSYMQSKVMYRTIFAANPTTPVAIMTGGGVRGIADLMQSSADSISSLTGEQLWAQNIANGGAVYGQGLGANTSGTGSNLTQDYLAADIVMASANNCPSGSCMPWYWFGSIPQSTGPGVLSTRNSKDPLYLNAVTQGSDTRQAYDSLPASSFASYRFANGATVAITTSGTGYANVTPFISSGGGTNCSVSGNMISSGGVPSSVQNGTASLGYSCTSAPTLSFVGATGTGAVLTATLTASTCGTITPSTTSTSWTSSSGSCTGQYFLPASTTALPSYPYILTWFLNSLVDPPPNGAPRGRQ